MIRLRKSEDRGVADLGWLQSRHTFSFAEYFDRQQMGFRSLRVINEDWIQPGGGFGDHPHSDMEIISYVVQGALEHQDSMGHKLVIRPGEVQVMSAGRGVIHAERCASVDAETHLFQIWIRPESRGGEPGYAQKSFDEPLSRGQLVLVASKDGRDGSLVIKQDAEVYLGRLSLGKVLNFKLRNSRGLWLHLIHGRITANNVELKAGDALAIEDEPALELKVHQDCELMLFDLA